VDNRTKSKVRKALSPRPLVNSWHLGNVCSVAHQMFFSAIVTNQVDGISNQLEFEVSSSHEVERQ